MLADLMLDYSQIGVGYPPLHMQHSFAVRS